MTLSMAWQAAGKDFVKYAVDFPKIVAGIQAEDYADAARVLLDAVGGVGKSERDDELLRRYANLIMARYAWDSDSKPEHGPGSGCTCAACGNW